MNITKSLKYLKRANKVIPGQTSTISKRYGRFPQGVAPAYLTYGKGCKVYDIDGNEYIDWSASLGTVIIGYGNDDTLPLFSFNLSLPLPRYTEILLAEKLVDIIPCAEMVRFFKNGSDACSAAVMLAKKVTGRKVVVSTGYHGWHSWGYIPIEVEYGNLEKLESVFNASLPINTFNVPACYILEPMDRSCPEKYNSSYLHGVRRLCDKYNVILIFDEILTGFRYSLSGIQELSGVIPDLACYGKAMSNGTSLSALVGKKDLMKELEHMRISGTYFTENNSFAYALNTIKFIEDNNIMSYIWDKGQLLKFGINDIIGSNIDFIKVKGFGPWNSIVWNNDCFDEQQLFLQEIFKRGIFYNRDHFIMYSHKNEDVEKTLTIYKEVFEYILDCRNKGIVKEKLISSIDRNLFR